MRMRVIRHSAASASPPEVESERRVSPDDLAAPASGSYRLLSMRSGRPGTSGGFLARKHWACEGDPRGKTPGFRTVVPKHPKRTAPRLGDRFGTVVPASPRSGLCRSTRRLPTGRGLEVMPMVTRREPSDRVRIAQLVLSGARLVIEIIRWW
jgi:hypothetical protein